LFFLSFGQNQKKGLGESVVIAVHLPQTDTHCRAIDAAVAVSLPRSAG
jgi:hypothetical protein